MLVFRGIGPIWTVLLLAMLAVASDIYVEPNTRSLTVWEGQSQELVCYIMSSYKAVNLTWAKDPPQGGRYTVSNETTTNNDGSFKISRTLTFQSFNINDAGTYTCTWVPGPSDARQWAIKLHFQKRCDPGMYDIGCTKNCSSHCKKTDRKPGICDYTDGACLDGCQSGYRGFNCTAVCAYGDYGPDCIHACSEHCKEIRSDTSPCQHVNGTCLAGCKPGYKGALCTTAAASESGPSTGVIIGIVISLVFVMIVLSFLIYHFRRKICSVCGWSKDGNTTADPERERFNPTSDSTTVFASPSTTLTTTTEPATTTASLDVHQVWTQQSTPATTSASTIAPIASAQTYTTPALNPGPICASGATRPAAQDDVFREQTPPGRSQPPRRVMSSHTPVSSTTIGSAVDQRMNTVCFANAAYGGAACLDDGELTDSKDITSGKYEDELKEMKGKLGDKDRYIKELEAQMERERESQAAHIKTLHDSDHAHKTTVESQAAHIKTLQDIDCAHKTTIGSQAAHIKTLQDIDCAHKTTIEKLQRKIKEETKERIVLVRQIIAMRAGYINKFRKVIDDQEKTCAKIKSILEHEGSEPISEVYQADLQKLLEDQTARSEDLQTDVMRMERENEELERTYDQDSRRKAKSRSETDSELDDRTRQDLMTAARSSSAPTRAGAGHDAQNLDELQGASTINIRKEHIPE